jgi:hypothetical protein
MDRDDLRQIGREMNEIIYAAPVLRSRDENGVEWVARDDLVLVVRDHFLLHIRLIDAK